jgi:cell volume regulation protein A
LTLEMVGYPVTADSAVMHGATVPRWARPAFVIRNEVVVMPADAGNLRDGDTAYYLAPPARAAQLDALFAHHAELLTADEPFFGEFVFAGDVKLREVATFYDLKLAPEMSETTIAALFAASFDDAPEIGDHLRLGAAIVVAREVVDGVVSRAGLQLAASPEDAAVSTVRAGLVRLRRFFSAPRRAGR